MTEIQSVRKSQTMAILEIIIGKRLRLGVNEFRMGALPQRGELCHADGPPELANR